MEEKRGRNEKWKKGGRERIKKEKWIYGENKKWNKKEDKWDNRILRNDGRWEVRKNRKWKIKGLYERYKKLRK